MRVSCFCRRYRINPDFATFVKNGVPMCNAATCQKVQEHREAMLRYPDDADRLEADLARREHATRIIGSFEEGFAVEVGERRRQEMRDIERREPVYDDVGNEVYAR